MMAVCMWYAHNREEAEEILQDGFLRIFKYVHTFNRQGSFEAWIRSIMVSAALTKYRNKSARMWVVMDPEIDEDELFEEPIFASSYDEKELLKLVQKLPPMYRLVFNLYVFEGYKHKQIASLLDISEGTSKSNLHDARKILQRSIVVREQIAQIRIKTI
jgi:RNA polymerase sigma-70 factor (ECF subfamily)